MAAAAAIGLVLHLAVMLAKRDWWVAVDTRAGRASRVGLVLAVATLGVSIVLRAAGIDRRLDPLDGTGATLAGLALIVVGFEAAAAVQIHRSGGRRLGDRPGMLRTEGVYAVSRNPLLLTLGITGAGVALVVGNLSGLFGAVLLVAAVQFRVRAVEEPLSRARHGDAYVTHARATGRFLPLIGRLR